VSATGHDHFSIMETLRSPEFNGGVERCNGDWRYEFYTCTEPPGSVAELNPLIDDWQETYNFVRPHGALAGLTPAEYLLRRQANGNSQFSQIS
jgi:transposase InsO family protein